jgi:hypothetical protein
MVLHCCYIYQEEEKNSNERFTIIFSYRFGHISRTLKALQHSFKTSLRIDRDGLLSLQFLMPKPGRNGGGDAFIEFRVSLQYYFKCYLNTQNYGPQCLALDDEF